MRLPRLYLLLLLAVASPAYPDPVADLREVGRASLRVLLWPVFDSVLFSANGSYQEVEPGLALEIRYRRDIDSADLVRSTLQEWNRQSLCTSSCDDWLREAGSLWPDIAAGDRLLLRVNDRLGSEFFFNDRFIGTIDDPEFTERFLAIFISEDSSYPRLQRRLTGSAG